MFDISFSEFMLIGGVAFAVLGRKQVAVGAYVVGKGMGRAVGFVNRGRDAVENVISSQQMSGVNSELSEGFRQFSDMRRELQSARMNPVETVKSAILTSNRKQPQTTMQSSIGNVTYNSQTNNSLSSSDENTSTKSHSTPIFPQHNNKGTEKSSNKNNASRITDTPITEQQPGGADLILSSIEELELLERFEEYSKNN